MDVKRIVPIVPQKGEQIDIIIDSDVANEIDDLYAIMMPIYQPERFNIKGFVTTHFAFGGPTGTQKSYDLLHTLLEKAGKKDCYPIKKGSAPLQYIDSYNESEGVDFIIETAKQYTPEKPLWVVGIGAATNLACAILKAPEIMPNVRYVFHARCSHCWPTRSEQFNVYGDIIAAITLLNLPVPLVWFDTGTDICASYEETETRLAPLGEVGKWLHEYRNNNPWYAQADKGFFDMGDFAYLMDPTCCKEEVVDAPEMTRFMYFNHNHNLGQMQRVYDIDVKYVWDLFYQSIQDFQNKK